jgi:HrpA-like RNA helicase
MSATLNAQLFADYFSKALVKGMAQSLSAAAPSFVPGRRGGAPKAPPKVDVPILAVQGKMYPVREIYLEEALKNVDLSRCMQPPKRTQQLKNDDEDEQPELSQRFLSNAAARAGGNVGRLLLSPHCTVLFPL